MARSQEKTDAPFRFHQNHADWVVVSDCRTIAFKKQGHGKHGVLFSEEPMKLNRLYEFVINNVKGGNEELSIGTAMKDALTVSAKDLNLRKPGMFVINRRGVWANGKWSSKTFDQLKSVPVFTRLGLALKGDRNLHLYYNGHDAGIVSPKIPDSCYFMFDLCDPIDMITTCPLKVL